MPRPRVICLTPVLNEAWILGRFLECASLWADQIIVADQNSTDGSREIAKRFSKVRFLENRAKAFNEPERQQLLLAEARRIPGPRLLLALDADEVLSAKVLDSPEWDTILHAPAGTAISFPWPMVHHRASEFSYYYLQKELTVGYVDDGAEHVGQTIHSCRVPTRAGCKTLRVSNIQLMHYCLMDHDRFDSRIRWYQCWELLNVRRRPIGLYRFYHTDLFVPSDMIRPVPAEWVQGYEQRGINMTSVNREVNYRWDKEVLGFFDEHGTARFRRLAIWDTDWTAVYARLYPDRPKKVYRDPRTCFDKIVHRWLRRSQQYYCFHRAPNSWRELHHRIVGKVLRPLGW
jgi:glycosyltransferase involved in cell wall biosynthesis